MKQESSFPPFPYEVIKGFAKDFVDLYQGKREVPAELLWASFATYFGSLVSRYVRLEASGTSEARFYTVNIGRSGRSKKSTAQNLARDLIGKLWTDNESKIRIIEGFASAEGLVSQLQMLTEKQPAILHLDELNVLAHKTGMDGSIGISILNKLFEDHHYEHPLRDKNLKISDAHLSIVGASTSEDYQKVWSGKHKDTGFFSRLFVVPAEPSALKVPVPLPVDPDALERLKERIRERYEALRKAPAAFKIDPDAAALWGEYYTAFEDGEEWNRIDTYAFRLMSLQTALTQEHSVTKEIMEDVIKLSKYQVESRIQVSPVIAENQLAMVEQLIRRQLPPGSTMTRRELQRKINANRYGTQNYSHALSNLVASGELQSAKTGKTVEYTRIEDPDEPDEELSSVIISTDDRCAA